VARNSSLDEDQIFKTNIPSEVHVECPVEGVLGGLIRPIELDTDVERGLVNIPVGQVEDG
jgi:hypothetical protein